MEEVFGLGARVVVVAIPIHGVLGAFKMEADGDTGQMQGTGVRAPDELIEHGAEREEQ